MADIIRQSFNINLNVLHLFGFYTPGTKPIVLQFRAFILYFFLLVLSTISTAINVFLGNLQGMQMNLMVTFVADTTSFCLKIIPFIQDGERIRKCINFFAHEAFAPKDKQEEKIIDECIRICRRNSVVYFYGCVMTALIWDIRALFAKGRTFPLELWLPYDATVSDLNYYITFLYASTVTMCDGLLGTVMDPLIGGLAYHATAQLKILKYNLQHLPNHVGDAGKNEYAVIKYTAAQAHLEHCIEHHNNILSFVADYEECFSRCVFWQLAGSLFSICFCCIGFTLVSVASVDGITYVFSFCIVSFQIFFYCHYGTLLYEENNSLMTAIYMGPWYRYDVKIRKMLLTVMERSKRPMIFTAGAVFHVTLDTFVSVLKSSYSLVAVLNNYG